MLLLEVGVQSWRVEQGLVAVLTTKTTPILSSTNICSSPNKYTTSSTICRVGEREYVPYTRGGEGYRKYLHKRESKIKTPTLDEGTRQIELFTNHPCDYKNNNNMYAEFHGRVIHKHKCDRVPVPRTWGRGL